MYLTPPLRLKIPANQGGFVKGGAQNRAHLRRKFSLLRGGLRPPQADIFWRFGTLFYTENTSQNAL